ncbi:MAG TPA: hypothetical protein VGA55_01610 [Bacteroidota bacterium]
MKASRLFLAFVLLIAGGSVALSQNQVQFDINIPNYDVVYVSDLVDVSSGKLKQGLPEMSITLRNTAPAQIFLRVRIELQLREGPRKVVVDGRSEPFDLNGVMRLSARDLAGRGALIKFLDRNTDWIDDNDEVAKQIRSHIENFPTLPVGNLFISVAAFNPINPTVSIGDLRHTITIRNSSESEVVVTLVSPEHGQNVPTPFPTFTWTSQKPNVTLYVYEKLPVHRSAEEAVTGIPYLKRDLTGISTFTYPADAARRLEMNKTYLWFVETRVVTTRGDLTRRSEVRLFRVHAGGGDNALARLLSTLPGDVASQLQQLMSDGWDPSGITLDGSPINQGELTALFQRLARENTEVNFRVED